MSSNINVDDLSTNVTKTPENLTDRDLINFIFKSKLYDSGHLSYNTSKQITNIDFHF